MLSMTGHPFRGSQPRDHVRAAATCLTGGGWARDCFLGGAWPAAPTGAACFSLFKGCSCTAPGGEQTTDEQGIWMATNRGRFDDE